MDILFKNSKLRKACQNAKGKLKRRLDDIRAAENMAVLKGLPGNLHPLKHDRKGQWGMSLEGLNRLVFRPEGDPLPVTEDGRLELEEISAIMVVDIGDYHGWS